ncbi:MAG: phytanoyl-CoA dioxygenase family protein [Rhodospirillaceae bacterium]
MTAVGFTQAEAVRFARDGFHIVRGMAARDTCDAILAVARRDLAARVPPVEYESDLGYPGAPATRDAPGGSTVRRLLRAYDRDGCIRAWATSPGVAARLRSLLGPDVQLSQAHHNCIMTKQPRHSSVTGWHRDVRYWRFERPQLVSIWLALGRETRENGCLQVLPGTHTMELGPDRLDEAQFLRTDVAANDALVATAVNVELEPGDVLFFHCRLFHAAGANVTSETKYSPVFTYHAADNRPLPGTRSASLPDISLAT